MKASIFGMLMVLAACGEEPVAMQVAGTSREAIVDVAPVTFRGLPIDEAKAMRVVHEIEKAAGRSATNLIIDVVGHDPFQCANAGLRDGCAQLVNGVNIIQLDTRKDGNGKQLGADITCSLLTHELVHYFFGDGEHQNRDLWYANGLTVRTLQNMGCYCDERPNFPPCR